jgi:inosine-uridine nucleoside N-ribohydrolase
MASKANDHVDEVIGPLCPTSEGERGMKMKYPRVIFGGLGIFLATAAFSPSSARADDGDGDGDGSERHRVPAVIVDTDVDFDDTVALAYLCALHTAGKIELKAVTVVNDGSGFPGDAIRNARCVLEACGQPNIPIADGGDVGVNAFPPIVRGAVGGIIDSVFTSCTASTSPAEISASDLIRRTIRESNRGVTLVTIGPLTNVAAALAHDHGNGDDDDDSGIARKIDRAFIMGGAVHVGGNIIPPPPFPPPAGTWDDSQELNIWADPPAAQAVLASLSPWAIHLVANDATNHVPVTVDFLNRVGADHTTPAADVVNALTHQPFFFGAISAGVSFSWADPLDAVASDTSSIVSYEWDKISVVQTGPSAGRTISVAHDQPGVWMRVGINANQAAFENDLLDVLNGG